ncbi:MAG: YajQ family cyclic di-GMP-binding protein [bacterium]
MPSFDVVSEVNMHEVSNAVDQANREVSTRFDFKASDARFERTDAEIMMFGDNEFQLKQMLDILYTKLTKRKVPLKSLLVDPPEESGKGARQRVTVRQGVETDMAKKIVKMVKETRLKVQAAVQGDKVRISGKKRDDLQQVIAMLKEADLDIPLQYTNYRE